MVWGAGGVTSLGLTFFVNKIKKRFANFVTWRHVRPTFWNLSAFYAAGCCSRALPCARVGLWPLAIPACRDGLHAN